jgi:hypothetical protein
MSGFDSSSLHSATRRFSQPQRVCSDLHLVLGVRARRRDDRLVVRLLGRELVEVGVGLRVRRIDLLELLLGVEQLAEAGLDFILHGLVRIDLRLLRQEADLQAGHRHGFALDLLVDARHDAQQGRLAGAVQSQHADLGAREERQRNVLQDLPLGRNDLAHADHGINVLGHWVRRGEEGGRPRRLPDRRGSSEWSPLTTGQRLRRRGRRTAVLLHGLATRVALEQSRAPGVVSEDPAAV